MVILFFVVERLTVVVKMFSTPFEDMTCHVSMLAVGWISR